MMELGRYGCQAKFREIVPKALYFHCSSHKLNLVLSEASSVSSIHCMLSDLKSLEFFSSTPLNGNVTWKGQLSY